MDSTEKIILYSEFSKASENKNMSLNTVIGSNKKLLPGDGINDSINLYDEYLKERKESNKFRLILTINPYCSNVLFNPFTEIVKYDVDDEGNPKNTILNFHILSANTFQTSYYSIIDSGDPVIVKESVGKKRVDDCYDNVASNRFIEGGEDDGEFKWTAYDAIRDTQLSNDKCGFNYYCGLDIFNNHILRNKGFKSLNYGSLSNETIDNYKKVYGNGYDEYIDNNERGGHKSHIYVVPEDFNTIDDYMRDRNGVVVSDCLQTSYNNSKSSPLHLYQKTDILSFEDCVNSKLIEQNGWFGFKNASILNSLSFGVGEGTTTSNEDFNVSPSSVILNDCEENAQSTGITTNLNITANSLDSNNQEGKRLDINKVINNRKYCDFIDMYPSRELYSFTPLFNEIYKRYEKNWNYCLTYPSKSITKNLYNEDFPFFYYLPDGTVSLNTVAFDEFTVDDDGRDLVTIYSVCQHGLKEGDDVNIYKGDELFYNNGKVVNVIDKYVFQIYKDSANISSEWINVDELKWELMNGVYVTLLDGSYAKNYGTYIEHKGINYVVCESKRCSIDETARQVSFKRVVNNIECEYYVRLFSRLPNFKFVDAEVNDYNLYENEKLNLIKKYSDPLNKNSNFESHISDASFARTYYGDSSTQIIFTDDIDVSYLKDNLGRPLSEIYFTICKNNKGYEKWYKNKVNGSDFKDIEFSHCFGYNSSSFLLNEIYRKCDNGMGILKDVRDINAGEPFGLKYNNENYFSDEFKFDEVSDYYGDICCYSSTDCDEMPLQGCMGRFNTVQREMSHYPEFKDSYCKFFNSYLRDSEEIGIMEHDEIIDDESGYKKDDYLNTPYENFNCHEETAHDFYHSSYHKFDRNNDYYTDMLNFREGYYYKMHYKVQLKTISQSLSSDSGIFYDMFSMEAKNGNLLIQTIKENKLSLNDKLILYNKTKNKFYYLAVLSAITEYYFECSVKNEDLSEGFNDEIDFTDDFSLMKKNSDTPEYAKIIKDGSCRYYWRNIISNGIESGDSKIYPFTNGAFYINRQINFFLRRQDPKKETLGSSIFGQLDYTPEGERLPIKYYDNQYYDSDEIETC